MKERDGGAPFATYNEIKSLHPDDDVAVAHCKTDSGHKLRTYAVWNGSGWNNEGIAAAVRFAELYGPQSEAMPDFWTWYGSFRGSWSPMNNVSPETGIDAVGVKRQIAKMCSATRTGLARHVLLRQRKLRRRRYVRVEARSNSPRHELLHDPLASVAADASVGNDRVVVVDVEVACLRRIRDHAGHEPRHRHADSLCCHVLEVNRGSTVEPDLNLSRGSPSRTRCASRGTSIDRHRMQRAPVHPVRSS